MVDYIIEYYPKKGKKKLLRVDSKLVKGLFDEETKEIKVYLVKNEKGKNKITELTIPKTTIGSHYFLKHSPYGNSL